MSDYDQNFESTSPLFEFSNKDHDLGSMDFDDCKNSYFDYDEKSNFFSTNVESKIETETPRKYTDTTQTLSLSEQTNVTNGNQ